MLRPRRLLIPGALALAALAAPGGPAPAARGDEWSPRYKEELRRTAELRKQRRGRAPRGGAGVIVPYPMPPALIIRQTPENHDEIRDLIRLLRGI